MTQEIRDTTRHSRVAEFGDTLLQLNLSIGLQSAGDAFAQAHLEAVDQIKDSMLEALEDVTEADRLDRLVEHWIEWYHVQAWRLITKTISTGYGSFQSFLKDQAVATASNQFAEALTVYRRHQNARLAFIDMSSIRVAFRPE